MLRNRGTTLLSICGLALGMCCTVLICLYIQYDLNYDSFHENKERIYQLLVIGQKPDGQREYVNSIPLSLVGKVIQKLEQGRPQLGEDNKVIEKKKRSPDPRKSFAKEYPQLHYIEPTASNYITEIVRFSPQKGFVRQGNKIAEAQVHFTDSNFFRMFDFKLTSGRRDEVLRSPGSVVLTVETAKKYFGKKEPVGKTILFYKRPSAPIPLKITGVLDTIPANSSLSVDFLAYLPFEELSGNLFPNHFGKNKDLYTFAYVEFGKVKRKPQPTLFQTILKDLFVWQRPVHITAVAADFIQDLSNIKIARTEYPGLNKRYDEYALACSPFGGAHFARNRVTLTEFGEQFDYYNKGNLLFSYLLFIIGILVLFISCVNTISLSTARAGLRAKEIAIRKVMGADKRDLILQFFLESTLLCCLAMVFGLALTELFLPLLNSMMDRALQLDYAGNWPFFLVILGIGLLAGIFSGIYPAFFLSGFPVLNTLRGEKVTHSSNVWKYLIIFQICVSMCILIFSLFLSKESTFLRNKALGFQTENIVFFRVAHDGLQKKYKDYKESLFEIEGVDKVAASSHVAGRFGTTTPIKFSKNSSSKKLLSDTKSKKGETRIIKAHNMEVDPDFLDLYSIDLLAPNNSFEERKEKISCFINQTARRAFSGTSIIGTTLIQPDGTQCRIGGVVEDFSFSYSWRKLEPLVLRTMQKITDQKSTYISVRLSPSGPHQKARTVLREIGGVTARFFPNQPYFPRFVANEVKRMRNEISYDWETILQLASFVSIILAALGLFGFAEHEVERKTKEFGIRKALGASRLQICISFAYQFIPMVILASAIAWLTSAAAIPQILQLIEYPRSFLMSLPVFMFSCSTALFITMCIVGSLVYRAASIDPAESLRDQ